MQTTRRKDYAETPQLIEEVETATEGVPQRGIRVSGTHKGFKIEKTAWAPTQNFDLAAEALHRLASGRYAHEVRVLDGTEEPRDYELD